jgi:hypothetical protein
MNDKISNKYINLDYTDNKSINADNIAYNSTLDIKEGIELQRKNLSAGVVVTPTLTDNLIVDLTVTIGNGSYRFYENADFTGNIFLFENITGGIFAIASMPTITYIVANYNSGSPIIQATTDRTIINESTIIPIFTLTRLDTTLRCLDVNHVGLGLSNKLHKRLFETDRFDLIQKNTQQFVTTQSSDVNRYFYHNGGELYFGTKKVSIQSYSSATDAFNILYKNSNVWYNQSYTGWPNLYYSDNAGLQELNNNKYGFIVLYAFVSSDVKDVCGILSTTQYNKEDEARRASIPEIPENLFRMGYPIAKLTFKKGSNTAVIDPIYDNIIIKISSILHNDTLSKQGGDNSLDEFYHLALEDYTRVINSYDLTNEPTGFAEPELALVTANGDRTITLSGTINAYYKGIKATDLFDGYISPAHDDNPAKVYFLTHNGTDIAWRDISIYPNFFKDILIAYTFYAQGSSEWVYNKETHGLMQWQNHAHFHNLIGTYKKTGGDFSSFVLNSTVVADRRPIISQTDLKDEDLESSLPELLSGYTYCFLTNSGIFNFSKNNDDIIPLLVNNPYYNQFNGTNWVQTLLPANSIATIWVIALPVALGSSQPYRYLFLQPQWFTQAKNSSEVALLEAIAIEENRTFAEVSKGNLDALEPESVVIGRITIAYTNNWVLRTVQQVFGNKISQTTTPSGNFITIVNTDDTLTGAGTPTDVLGVDYNLLQRIEKYISGHSPITYKENGDIDYINVYDNTTDLNLIYKKQFFYDADDDVDYIEITELETNLKLKITFVYDVNKNLIDTQKEVI